MKSSLLTKLAILLPLTAPLHAQAEPTGTDAREAASIGPTLAEFLSLLTMGTIKTNGQAAELTHDDAGYRVKLPLSGFLTGQDAAVDALVRPLDGGSWDITSMTFPSEGTIQLPASNDERPRVTYSIGSQASHGRVDPGLSGVSSLAADLADVRMQTDLGDQHSDQDVALYNGEATVTGDGAGRVNLTSRSKIANWHMKSRTADGGEIEGVVRSLAGDLSIEGLDRLQASRLPSTERLLADMRDQTAGSTPPPPRREAFHALIDALPGLMSRFIAREDVSDVRFTAGAIGGGGLGRLLMSVSGDATGDRLNARLSISVDDLAMDALPPDAAAYVPHRFEISLIVGGIRSGSLMALLRDVGGENPDLTALRDQGAALLTDPDVRAGIESIAFDSGPMRMTGSAAITPQAQGEVGAKIHLSATGLDALIAQAQATPDLQQALPVLVMAKGMGRVDGNALVWDVALGDGPVTINGLPFGQPAPRKR